MLHIFNRLASGIDVELSAHPMHARPSVEQDGGIFSTESYALGLMQTAWAHLHELRPSDAHQALTNAHAKFDKHGPHWQPVLRHCLNLASNMHVLMHRTDFHSTVQFEDPLQACSIKSNRQSPHLILVQITLGMMSHLIEDLASGTSTLQTYAPDQKLFDNGQSSMLPPDFQSQKLAHTNGGYAASLLSLAALYESLSKHEEAPQHLPIGIVNAAISAKAPDIQALAQYLIAIHFYRQGIFARARALWLQAAEIGTTLEWPLLTMNCLFRLKQVHGTLNKDAALDHPTEELIQSSWARHVSFDHPNRKHRLSDDPFAIKHNRGRRIEFIIKFVKENLGKRLTSEILAATVQASVRTIETDFKVSTGQSLQGYVAQERMLAAKKLVVYSHLSILKIANRFGYESALGFSKAYTRVHGISPAEQRASISESISVTNDSPDFDA